jgi:hypothetical protein
VNALFEAARDLQTFIDARGWGFCFIGGLAVLGWATVLRLRRQV